MRTRSLAALFCLFTAACSERSSLPYYVTPELTPEWLDESSAQSATTHRIGPFRFVNQNADTLTQANLAGKISVVHFFYTRCTGVCPKTVPNLAGLLRQFPAETRIQVLSHSVTPESDSVSILKAFADQRGIKDARWNFLTGPESSLEQVARDSYFVNLRDGTSYGVKDLAHTETILLVDEQLRIRGVYSGSLQLDIQRLQDDITTLLGE